jgi:hypothetical protein
LPPDRLSAGAKIEGVLIANCSTIAAACACGLRSIGLEITEEYYRLAVKAVPVLASLPTETNGNRNGSRR